MLVFVSIAAAIIWSLLNIRRGRFRPGETWKRIQAEFRVFSYFKTDAINRPFSKLRKMSYLSTLVCFIVLAITAYLQIIVTGGPLTGWLLIIHVTVAPLFTFSLTSAILLWAHLQRYNRQDWQFVRGKMNKENLSSIAKDDHPFWEKLTFWLFMLAAIPAIVSIILQLYPWFDQDGMAYLLEIHRYSTLILFVLVLNHGRIWIRRMNQN
jgi:cytochrome b subunit of formate dehydrogenase